LVLGGGCNACRFLFFFELGAGFDGLLHGLEVFEVLEFWLACRLGVHEANDRQIFPAPVLRKMYCSSASAILAGFLNKIGL
jgi:hypothetical protein